MNSIIKKIRAELKSEATEENKKSFQRFFKDGVKCYGVRMWSVDKIAKKYWQNAVKEMSKKEVFALCEEFFSSGYCEEAFVANNWAPKLADKFEKKDLAIFKKWIDKYIDNWAKCDGFCNHSVGEFIEKYPASVAELKKWTKSKNRWLRRAAAVSLIIPAKKGMFLKDIFAITDILLEDKEDMVQKGYGWMLKEASRKPRTMTIQGKHHQEEVFNYVMKNKKKMPRVALRYAIELMPKELRVEAMAK